MNLKRGLVAASFLAVSLPVVAADINQIQTLTQDEFHKLSQDLGAALSYKPLTPAEPLHHFGFDLGVAATDTKIKNTDVFQKAGATDISDIAVPSLRFNLGLPFSLDVGAMVGGVPGTNVRLYGGGLRWAFVKGSTTFGAASPSSPAWISWISAPGASIFRSRRALHSSRLTQGSARCG